MAYKCQQPSSGVCLFCAQSVALSRDRPLPFTGRSSGSGRPELFAWSGSYLAAVCGSGEETKKAEMVNCCRFWRKTELEAFVVQMKIAHFLSAWTVGVKVLQGTETK